MASDGSTSAWSALKAAVWRYPAISVLLVAMLLPLLGVAAVFLAPFAFPLGVVALVFMKFTKSEDEADVDCAASRVAARSELWGIIAEHSGLVGAWQLTGVCRASREGAKEWLRTLPGLVVCGGVVRVFGVDGTVSDVLRLDLATMRWVPMPALATARSHHACCAVRGALVVLGGLTPAGHHGHEC
jgi:hypothetical protein